MGGGLFGDLGGRTLALYRRVPLEARDHLGVLIVDDERAQGLADLALVVVQQEVDPLGVVQRALGRGHGVQSVEGDEGIRLSRRLALGVRVALRGGEQCPARHALGRVAVGALDQGLVELHDVEGRDHPQHLAAVVELLGDGLPLLPVLGGEELGHRVALVHGGQRDHGLAAEEVLVGDAVLVDLVALVEVAVLARGELELGDAEAEPEGDQEAHDGHEAGPLAELHRQYRPETLHVPTSRLRPFSGGQ